MNNRWTAVSIQLSIDFALLYAPRDGPSRAIEFRVAALVANSCSTISTLLRPNRFLDLFVGIDQNGTVGGGLEAVEGVRDWLTDVEKCVGPCNTPTDLLSL